MSFRTLPNYLAALIVLIGVSHSIVLFRHLQFTHPWVDIPLHLAGGLWIGLFSLWLYYSDRTRFPEKDRSLHFVVTVALVSSMTIGAAWELFEYVVNLLTVGEFYDLVDMLADLTNDAIGALSGAAFFVKRGYNREQ